MTGTHRERMTDNKGRTLCCATQIMTVMDKGTVSDYNDDGRRGCCECGVHHDLCRLRESVV